MRYNKLPAAYWGSACWIIPQDAYASIAALTANQVPLFIPSADYSVSIQNAAPFTLFGLPVYVTEYLPTHDSTASTGKNVVAVLGSVQDAFSIREWGGMTMLRDEISAASSARIKFYAMAFANSVFTRSKALVQLQVTNAAT
jgi:HK97 family phage major capsid protein